MIKTFGRALLIVVIIILVGIALWYHPIITAMVLVIGWLALMIYLDPPEKWN